MTKKGKPIIKAVLLATLLYLSAVAQPQTITGKVVGVSDGDTITVLDEQKRQHKIRLDGIDAPESSQDFGSRSKQSLSDLVFSQVVTVTSSKKDRYDRTVGKVTLEGRDINLEQLNCGLAWFYRAYARELSRDDAVAYERAENDAKAGKRGLWADPSPTPPWEFRRGGRTAKAPATAAATSGSIIGNRNSKIYHLPNCPNYTSVSERNRVSFATEAEARAARYRKARNCPP